jgi:hypothetical protein
MQLLLQGAAEAELPGPLRASWRGVAHAVIDALIASADPQIPFEVELSDTLLVDPTSPVSYFTPITLRRTTMPTTGDVGTRADVVEGDSLE